MSRFPRRSAMHNISQRPQLGTNFKIIIRQRIKHQAKEKELFYSKIYWAHEIRCFASGESDQGSHFRCSSLEDGAISVYFVCSTSQGGYSSILVTGMYE